MSNSEDYNAKLENILAIPDDQIKVPSPPVPVALQEAEDLYHWSMDDKEALKVVGITLTMLKDLPVRTGACREAHSIWNKSFHSKEGILREWKTQAPLAFEFRDDLLQTMRYAYRKDEFLLGRVAALRAGGSNADMIQDLNDIAVVGKEYPEPLAAIGFDIAKLDQAAMLSDELAILRAKTNRDKEKQNELKVIRDKAFVYLKELVDEIRDAGKYVFRKDPQRYKGYISAFWKKKNSKTPKTSKNASLED